MPTDLLTTRRAFLATTGTVALGTTAGCGILSEDEPATVKWTLTETGANVDPITDGMTQEIDHGSYFTDGFEIVSTTEMAYTVEVIEGPDINVFILDEQNEDAFEANEQFEAVEESINLDVSYADHPGIELSPGTYSLILYNGDDTPENA